jgi:single-strand DNA-binding protein
LKTRKWTDKDGVEKYTTEIIADTMQMLGGAPKPVENETSGTTQARPRQERRPATGRQHYSTPDNFVDDDIPF